MIKKVLNYIKDDETYIQIKNESIYIKKYLTVKNFTSNIVSILTKNKLITFTGSNLVINKMLENDILITGTILDINFKDYDE